MIWQRCENVMYQYVHIAAMRERYENNSFEEHVPGITREQLQMFENPGRLAQRAIILAATRGHCVSNFKTETDRPGLGLCSSKSAQQRAVSTPGWLLEKLTLGVPQKPSEVKSAFQQEYLGHSGVLSNLEALNRTKFQDDSWALPSSGIGLTCLCVWRSVFASGFYSHTAWIWSITSGSITCSINRVSKKNTLRKWFWERHVQ